MKKSMKSLSIGGVITIVLLLFKLVSLGGELAESRPVESYSFSGTLQSKDQGAPQLDISFRPIYSGDSYVLRIEESELFDEETFYYDRYFDNEINTGMLKDGMSFAINLDREHQPDSEEVMFTLELQIFDLERLTESLLEENDPSENVLDRMDDINKHRDIYRYHFFDQRES